MNFAEYGHKGHTDQAAMNAREIAEFSRSTLRPVFDEKNSKMV